MVLPACHPVAWGSGPGGRLGRWQIYPHSDAPSSTGVRVGPGDSLPTNSMRQK